MHPIAVGTVSTELDFDVAPAFKKYILSPFSFNKPLYSGSSKSQALEIKKKNKKPRGGGSKILTHPPGTHKG